MITAFLLSRINSIINSKPFNFHFNNTGQTPLIYRPFFTSTYGSLFTPGQISRLITSLAIPLSRLKISGRKSRTPR